MEPSEQMKLDRERYLQNKYGKKYKDSKEYIDFLNKMQESIKDKPDLYGVPKKAMGDKLKFGPRGRGSVKSTFDGTRPGLVMKKIGGPVKAAKKTKSGKAAKRGYGCSR